VIAPRRTVTHRGTEYAIYQRGEAWVISIAGGEYFLTAGNDPTLQARRFLSSLPKNPIYPRTPAYVATEGHPLILELEGVIVRAWPALVPRDHPTWSKTYLDPRTGERVLATEDKPRWMFAARGRETTPDGEAKGEQTLAEVEQLAHEWLNSLSEAP
jgi:hypothetical protein